MRIMWGVMMVLVAGCSLAQECESPKDGYSTCRYIVTTQPACDGSCTR